MRSATTHSIMNHGFIYTPRIKLKKGQLRTYSMTAGILIVQCGSIGSPETGVILTGPLYSLIPS